MVLKQRFLFSAVLLVLFLLGCEKQPSFIPDFSTPEKALETAFHAGSLKMPELIFEALSHEILSEYGRDKGEQMATIKQDLKGLKKETESKIEIIRTEHTDENHATVFYRQLHKSKVIVDNIPAPMVREDGKWKAALVDDRAKTPEELAELAERKKILRRKYILDREKRVFIPTDEEGEIVEVGEVVKS